MNTDGRVKGGCPYVSPSDRWRGLEGRHFRTQSHPFSSSFSHLPGSSPRMTSIATSLSIPEPNRQRAVKAIPRLCHCRSAFPTASGNPLWVNYPLWKSHLSSNPWAQSPFRLVPSPFWTLLLLISCDVHLLCMPQNIVPCSPLPRLPYLFPFLVFLGPGESLWTSDPKRNLKMSAERKRQTHGKKD